MFIYFQGFGLDQICHHMLSNILSKSFR